MQQDERALGAAQPGTAEEVNRPKPQRHADEARRDQGLQVHTGDCAVAEAIWLLIEEQDEYLRMLLVRQTLVATGFTLQVVEPHLNGPGGEVPALLFPVEKGEPIALCGQGVAPAAAQHARHFRQRFGRRRGVVQHQREHRGVELARPGGDISLPPSPASRCSP